MKNKALNGSLRWLTAVAMATAGLSALAITPAHADAAPANYTLNAELKDLTSNAMDGAAWWNDPAGTNYIKYADCNATTSYTWRATDAAGAPIANHAVSLNFSNGGGENAHVAVNGTDVTPGSGNVPATTTDGDGYFTFSVTNTDTTGCEKHPSSNLPWEGGRGADLKANFHPTMGISGERYDGVWAHYVAAEVVTPPAGYNAIRLTSPALDGTNSVNHQADADYWVGQGWYHTGARSMRYYAPVGKNLHLTYKATDADGKAIANAAVTLLVDKQYSGSNATMSCGDNTTSGGEMACTGTTDASGNVSFDVANGNTAAQAEGYPADVTADQGGARLYSQITAIMAGQGSEAVDVVDFDFVKGTGYNVITLTGPAVDESHSVNHQGDADYWVSQGWYHPGVTFYRHYLVVGKTYKLTYHVVGKGGDPLADTAVQLVFNKQYSGSNAHMKCGSTHSTGDEATCTRSTDANGNVSFYLTNLNTRAEGEPQPASRTEGGLADGRLYSQVTAIVEGQGKEAIAMVDFDFFTPTAKAAAPIRVSAWKQGAGVKVGVANAKGKDVNIRVGNFSWLRHSNKVNDKLYVLPNSNSGPLSVVVTIAGQSYSVELN